MVFPPVSKIKCSVALHSTPEDGVGFGKVRLHLSASCALMVAVRVAYWFRASSNCAWSCAPLVVRRPKLHATCC